MVPLLRPDAVRGRRAFGHTALWGHLLLGLGWAAAFSAVGLVIFGIRTRTRRHPA